MDNPLPRKEYPRPCEIQSHQFYAEGMCIDIINGIAFVEHTRGDVARYDLKSVFSLRFTDRQ